MVVQAFEYTQNHWLLYFKWGDFLVAVVQWLSQVTPWTAAHQAPMSSSISQSWLKFMSVGSVMLTNHLILCCPLLLLPSVFPRTRSFPISWLFVSACKTIRASASASILPMNIQGWFPLGLMVWSPYCPRDSQVFFSTTVQKCSAFFRIQLSHPYTITGKTIALTMQTFFGKLMSLFAF